MSIQIIDMHNVKYSKKKHIRIDRQSKFGNPYVLNDNCDEEERIEVLWKYTLHLLRSPHILKLLPDLREKTLACWCYPTNKCHGQILAYLATHTNLIDKCYKPCTDKESVAEEIFRKLGWEYKKRHIQTTLELKFWEIPVEKRHEHELEHQEFMKRNEERNKKWSKQRNDKKKGKSKPAVCK